MWPEPPGRKRVRACLGGETLSLSLHLFNLFQAPLLRAYFVYNKKWHLQNIGTMSASEIPDEHWPFVTEVATEHFAGRRGKSAVAAGKHEPDAAQPASDRAGSVLDLFHHDSGLSDGPR